jgi:hypothetical protein
MFLVCLALNLSANAQFSDNFSDGDFTQNPEWNGTTEKFNVNNFELQLNEATASGSGSFKAYLATKSEAVLDASWGCKVRFTGTSALSSSNYVRFYLISDTADLTASLKGYCIVAGGTQRDVSLYTQNGTTLTKIIDGTDNRLNITPLNVEIKAERDNEGNWKLFSKLDSETDFVLEGTVFNKTFLNAKYSGIYVNYSSGNKDKYFFDDFSVSGEKYVFVPQIIERNALVINEIMADPDPPVALPNAEYIELYNRTDAPIDLAGWQIQVGNNNGTVSQGEIEPHGFLLLCGSTSRNNFLHLGAVAQVVSFPTLTNSAGLIVLKNSENQVVTFTEYSDKWFGNDNFRKNGGFSLERISPENLHNSAQNWQPSQDNSGGTPCRENSVRAENPDNALPQLSAVSLISENSATLIFNKEMNVNALQNIQNYFSETVNIISATAELPENKRVIVTFLPELNETDTIEISVKNLRCVSDFVLESFSFKIAKPQEILANDLIINELLFHTNDGVSTFAELFNASSKVLDLSEIFVTRRYNGELDAKKTVTEEHILLFPKKYLLLTDNISSVCTAYTCDEDALKIECALPSLPNAEGNLVIAKANADIIDEFAYSEKMHQNFVVNPRGVSLERINPYAPTQEPSNWHSASFDENYGTPSRQNSQYFVPKSDSDKNFWLEYETFTPDNDGFRDNLFLKYKLPENGFSLTATVYDAVGHKMRTLCKNAIAAIEGQIVWNALADNGSLCPIGVYVIVVEAVNLKNKTGATIKDKIICVLSAK